MTTKIKKPSKPNKPSEPKKPEQLVPYEISLYVYEDCNLQAFIDKIKEQLTNLVTKSPWIIADVDNFDLSKVKLATDHYEGGIDIYYSGHLKMSDDDFQQQLGRYNKSYIKFKEKLQDYNNKLEQYNKDQKEYDKWAAADALAKKRAHYEKLKEEFEK